MMKRMAAAVVVLLALGSNAGAQPAADAGLTKGIAQVQDGRVDDAVTTLNDVVRRLSARPIEFRVDLAQAYLWLGIAYAQLDSEKSARASFREALLLDGRVSLAEGWPPKVSRLFGEAKADPLTPETWEEEDKAAASGDPLSPEEIEVYKKYRHHADVLDYEEAEAVLRDWIARNPKSARACGWLAEFMFASFATGSDYGRAPRFEDGIEVAERCIALDDPKSPRSRVSLAYTFYDKSNFTLMTDEERDRFADLGLRYIDQALKLNRNMIDSVFVKDLLLRSKANLAKDEKKRKAYLAEAGRLRDNAMELKRSGKGELSGAALPFLRPGTSPIADDDVVGGVVGGVPGGVFGGTVGVPAPPPPPGAVRVGGEIKEPRRLKHVEPVYPEIARSARVQGVVIMECTISPQGKVTDVRVLRSIPLLDQAAIDAVKQWVYTPTLLNGVPVPVIMTVTANFTLS
jgi:TonB family protein